MARLTPNLRGPIEARRRLYVAVIYSVLMYGVPIWGQKVNTKALAPLRRVTRIILGRLTTAYKTVSLTAVEILAGISPLDLLVMEAVKKWTERERILSDGWNG